MENCTGSNEGLATLSGEVDVRFIDLLSPFDRAQGPACGEKAGSSRLKCHLNLEPWVLPGEINAMENCAGCNEGLATLSDEVGVRFIALRSLVCVYLAWRKSTAGCTESSFYKADHSAFEGKCCPYGPNALSRLF